MTASLPGWRFSDSILRVPASSSGADAADATSVSDVRVRLPGHRAVSQVPVHGWRAVLFALPFVVCGVGMALYAGLGLGSMDAPPELVVLAGAVFALIGGWLLVHGLMGVRLDKRVKAEQAFRPHEPWAWDFGWDPTGIEVFGSRAPGRWAVCSALAALLLAPFHLAAFDAQRNTLVLPLWVAVCDLGLLVALAYTVRLGIQRARFGSPRLAFAYFPFRAGEVLEVYLEGLRGLDHLDRLDCSLRFIEELYESTGQNGAYETNAYQLYSEDSTLDLRTPGPIPLRFSLPEAGLSTRLSARPPRYWELALHAPTKGPDFTARFLLPIYEKA